MCFSTSFVEFVTLLRIIITIIIIRVINVYFYYCLDAGVESFWCTSWNETVEECPDGLSWIVDKKNTDWFLRKLTTFKYQNPKNKKNEKNWVQIKLSKNDSLQKSRSRFRQITDLWSKKFISWIQDMRFGLPAVHKLWYFSKLQRRS